MKKTLDPIGLIAVGLFTLSCGASGEAGAGGSGGTGGAEPVGGAAGTAGGSAGAGAGGNGGSGATGAASNGGASTGGVGSGGAGAGGASTGGGSTGGTGAAGGSAGGAGGGAGAGGANNPVTLRVMSLNVYGHVTMPQSASTYAALIVNQKVDVVGIQEGEDDWQLSTSMPTDYSRAEALGAALGSCYQREYQIFVNTCRGNTLVKHERFDLTDGPNATRTGEAATVMKGGKTFGFIDVNWDHESNTVRTANAAETAVAANAFGDIPVVVLGTLNADCTSTYAINMSSSGSLDLIVDAGIDCIFSKLAPGGGTAIDAAPSIHDAVLAQLTL